MKFCMSGRQPLSVFEHCDEIKIQYKDKDRIFDILEDLSNKTIILEIPEVEKEIDWDLIKVYNEKNNLIICLKDLSLAKICQENNIKFYWGYPITNYYELNGIIKLNPCYLFLGAPLTFDLKKIKTKTSIPIRLCPNVAYDAYIPRENGICGQWIRPEDTEVYEKYVSVYEFMTNDLEKERALLHVYKDLGKWNGNLNALITNLNVDVENQVLPEEIGEIRSICGQSCMSNNICHYCENAFAFSKAVKKKFQESH